jgi:branched-subunit amino acid aminotransferase/4-amino-4-deoxychorismate lyase
MDIADEEGLPVETDLVRTSRLYAADEIFLTSTAGGVIPVATLDGSPVGRAVRDRSRPAFARGTGPGTTPAS